MNVVILRGTLSRPPVLRELPSGDQVVAIELTTRGSGERAESVPVAWLNPPRRVVDLAAGTDVVVTGRVRRRFFRAAGATASRTEVVAEAIVPATQRSRASRIVERALLGVDPRAD